ncbi:hypothetical protein DSECCO2_493430 [anaerobic digester metagenome]
MQNEGFSGLGGQYGQRLAGIRADRIYHGFTASFLFDKFLGSLDGFKGEFQFPGKQ